MENKNIFYLEKIENSSILKYKGCKIQYYKKEYFKTNIQGENIPQILGNVRLYRNKNINTNNILRIVKIDETYIDLNIHKPSSNKILGYIYVGDNTYVGLESIISLKNPLIIFVLLISLSCMLSSANAIYIKFVNIIKNDLISKLPINLFVENDVDDWDGKLPVNGVVTEEDEKNKSESKNNNIEIPGYSNLIVSEKTPFISLINPSNNDVYFVYEIQSKGKTIFKTNLIEPGKTYRLNILTYFNKGQHSLDFKITTFDMNTMNSYNGATQNVSITIK